MFFLAEKLGKSYAEVCLLSQDEIIYWQAYYTLEREDYMKQLNNQ